MFLAIRELRFARGRFVLMGSVVALIAILMVLLSGLSVGLVNDGVSGLKKLPVTGWGFQSKVSADAAFSRSLVDPALATTWRETEGIDKAEPFGNTLVNATSDRDVEVDLALFGVEPDGWLAPSVDGADLTDPHDILVSQTARDEGLRVGDTLTIAQVGTRLRVAGFLDGQHTFGHVEVAYVALPTWQEIRAGARPGEKVPDHAYDEVTAIAASGTDEALAAAAELTGTDAYTLDESFGASPGFTAETSTLQLIQGFLYAISALVVGAFFTVITIQRRQEIAVLRAMGASTGHLVRDSLVQSLILLLASVGAGVGVGVAGGAAISSTAMPFALDAMPITVASVVLITLGMLGAVLAVLRITRVDPLTALGGNR